MTSAEERAQQLYEKLAADPAWTPFDPLISDDTAEWVVDAITAAIQSAERDKANETWEAATKIAADRVRAYGCVVPECKEWSDGAVFAANSILDAIRSRIIEGKP